MATEIDDRQCSMDPSSVRKAPPAEEDEWGIVPSLILASLFPSLEMGFVSFFKLGFRGLEILKSVTSFLECGYEP